MMKLIKRRKPGLLSCNSYDQMDFIESLNLRVKKLSFLDVKLSRASNWFLALIIVKLIPEIMNVNIGWFIVCLILCTIKPFYVFWAKSDQLESLNKRLKKHSYLDFQLVKMAHLFFTLIVVKLKPEIMKLNIGWFVLLLFLFIIKPFYVFWIKDNQQDVGST